ncbi:hypothetical protein GGR57DRAFT_506678 [Xylariaceae sp. FL1272]|nr:hypothetical protein GGR57DRAFT_506678 [Xylariaceae sp. FL1272]
MSNTASLSPAAREEVERFGARIEFWLQTEGEERRHFWSLDSDKDSEYSYDAARLVQFTQQNCLATGSPDHPRMQEFKRQLQTDFQTCQTNPPTGADLCRLTSRYVEWIDEIFFFGLLLRLVRDDEGKVVKSRQIFRYECVPYAKGPNGELWNGVFYKEPAALIINMSKVPREPTVQSEWQDFDFLLCTIAHEMAHIYLHVLIRDNSPSRYWHQVEDNTGHGQLFWVLLNLMLTHLSLAAPGMEHVQEQREETFWMNDVMAARPLVSDDVANQLIREGASMIQPCVDHRSSIKELR